jgi:hypothetical protein
MESNRQILVIGSQCAAIPPPLSFLPGLAEELFRLMTDPQVGACSEGSSRLLIDPTADEAKTVIKEAFADASRNEATLVLAFIGHGQSIGDDFYLQLRDSPAEQVDDENAIHLVNLVKGQHRIHSNLDGLVQDRSDDQGTVGVIEASEQQSQDRTETPGSVSKPSWLERVKRFFRR